MKLPCNKRVLFSNKNYGGTCERDGDLCNKCMQLTEERDCETEKLIKEAKELYSLIEDINCFSVGDLRRYDFVVAELERRGYHVSESLKIQKNDEE